MAAATFGAKLRSSCSSSEKILISIGCGTAVRSPIRSSINWAISIWMPGTSCSIRPRTLSITDSMSGAGKRLEADEEIALVGLGHAAAELQAGPPRIGLDGRGAAEDGLDLAQQAVGLGQRGARGRVVVEDEAALVHRGHEAGAGVLVGVPAGRQQRQRAPAATSQGERSSAAASASA